MHSRTSWLQDGIGPKEGAMDNEVQEREVAGAVAAAAAEAMTATGARVQPGMPCRWTCRLICLAWTDRPCPRRRSSLARGPAWIDRRWPCLRWVLGSRLCSADRCFVPWISAHGPGG